MESLLVARRQQGEATVLIIDEAQSLSLDLLEEVRLLANIETNEEKLLSVILAGQPELAERLNERSLRQLKQRVALRCGLRALTPQESCAYVAGRIRAAGGVGAQTFTLEAVMLMHERAGGIPRTLSVIADNSLLTGFALEQRPVNSRTVMEVCADLDLESTTAAAPAPAAPKATPAPAPGPTHASNRLITFEPAAASTDSVTERPARLLDTGTGPKRRRFSIF